MSALHSIGNEKPLNGIHESGTATGVHSNGGTSVRNKTGDLEALGECAFHPDVLTDVASLAQMIKKCRVAFDNDIEPVINVHKKNGDTVGFN